MNIETKDILLFEVNSNDFEFFYNIKCEENNIYWSGYNQVPEYNRLKDWFNETIRNKSKNILIIKHKNISLGYVSYKVYDNILCDDFSIAVSEKYNGYGIGTKSMELFYTYIKINFALCKQICSYIREDNIASQHIHRNNGYILTDEYEMRYFEIDKKEYRMQKWIKNII